MAMIKQIDADIKDEAEAHRHYKELADKFRNQYGDYVSGTHYYQMSEEEGGHLKRLMEIRVRFVNQYM